MWRSWICGWICTSRTVTIGFEYREVLGAALKKSNPYQEYSICLGLHTGNSRCPPRFGFLGLWCFLGRLSSLRFAMETSLRVFNIL
jgi:hypothetical protein